MPLPSMDASALQRGLDSLGQALGRQRAIRNQQAAATASLTFRQKMNDKLDELDKRRDLGGDWGDEMRSWSLDAVNELEVDFTDEQAKVAWQTEALGGVEGRVPQFRDIQLGRLKAWTAADLNSGLEKAVEAAANDDYGTLIVSTNKLIGTPKTGITDAAYQVYGAEAPKKAQEVVDRGSGLFVDRSIERVMGDEKATWAEKAAFLEVTQKRIQLSIENYAQEGHRPSAATQAKLDDAWATAKVKAQKNAATELESAQLRELYAAEENDVQGFSDAKFLGSGYKPAQLRSFADRADLVDSVKSKASDMVAKYTREIPHSTEEDDKKLRNAKISAQKSMLTAAASKDAKGLRMEEIVNKMATVGWQGVTLEGGMTYDEAMKFAKGLKPVSENPEIQALSKELVKDMKLSDSVLVRWTEAVGGILTDGKSEYIKDGALDRAKATALAQTLKEADDKEFINNILKRHSGWLNDANTADDREVGLFVQQMAKGAGLMRFDVPPTVKHPDLQPFLGPLQRMFRTWTGKDPIATAFNQGDRRGQVQFLSNGGWYEAAPDGKGGVTFKIIPGTEKPKETVQKIGTGNTQ